MKSVVNVFTASILTLIGTSLPALSGERYDWIEFYFDKDVKLNEGLIPGTYYGAELEFQYEAYKNYNLRKQNDEDIAIFEPELNLLFGYDDDRTRVHFEISGSKEYFLENPDNLDPDPALELVEAYWTQLDTSGNNALTVGRREISDEREWLFDEELDGAQLTLRGQHLALELMYGREEWLRKDFFADHDKDQPDFYFSRLYGNPFKDTISSVYGIYRDDRGLGDGELYWIGGSLSGEPSKSLNYWANIAMVLGDDDGRDVKGYGFDIGATYEARDLPWKPRLTAAYAFGSGDNGGSTDTAFRQTGVHGNGSDFGGRTSFQYYGLVLDPDLSNLNVLTLGIGVEVFNKTSIDLVYHHYRQDFADNRISGDALDRNPTGDSKSIGEEIDLIFAYRDIDNFELDLYGGVFLPGAAFGENDDPAWLGGAKVKFKF